MTLTPDQIHTARQLLEAGRSTADVTDMICATTQQRLDVEIIRSRRRFGRPIPFSIFDIERAVEQIAEPPRGTSEPFFHSERVVMLRARG